MAEAAFGAAIGRKLREARRQRGVTLRQLARRAGCSPGQLSLIERDRVSPTVATLMRICNSLGVALTYFFTASPGGANHLVRRGERSTLVSRASGAHHELLKAPGNECALNPMLVTLRPRSRRGDGPHAHAGEEFALLTKGRLRFRIGEHEYLLRRGHSLTFPSTLPHAWWNPIRPRPRPSG
jgi:transcriptional regulator with XRE-family HTH domain